LKEDDFISELYRNREIPCGPDIQSFRYTILCTGFLCIKNEYNTRPEGATKLFPSKIQMAKKKMFGDESTESFLAATD
jgi:hypothetical protein